MLSLVMMLTCFAFVGCGGDTVKEIPVAELRSTTVKVAFRGEKPADVTNVVKAINAKLADDGKPYNVEFLFIGETNYITDVENKSKKEGLDAAFVYIDDYANLISRKTLMNIKPYLDVYGENLVSQSPSYAWEQVTYNGGIYAIPRDVPLADYKDTLQVRKDWMEVLDLEEINTADDYDTYCAGISAYPGIGDQEGFWANMGEHNNTFLLREYCPGYYFPIQNYALRPVYIDVTKKTESGSYKVENFYKSDAFRNWSKKIGSYVQSGYTPAGGPAELTGHDFRFMKGLAGSLWSVVLKQSERIDEFLNTVPEPATGMPEPALYDVFLNKDAPKYVMTGADNLMAVLSYSQNPNETVDFFNWIKSEQENYDLFCYGVEGVNYFGSEKVITHDGKQETVQYISFVKGEGADKKVIKTDKRYSLVMPYWTVTDLDFNRWSANLDDEYILSRLDWEKNDANGDPENYVVNPLIGFTLDYSVKAFKDAQASVMASITLAAEFATGKSKLDDPYGDSGMTKYQKLLADLENAKIDTLISEVQKQVDAFIAAKK